MGERLTGTERERERAGAKEKTCLWAGSRCQAAGADSDFTTTFFAHQKRQRLMWRTRRGGRALRVHTLLPLPHLPHLPPTHTHTPDQQTVFSSLLRFLSALPFLPFLQQWRRFSFLLSGFPSAPLPFFTFLTATIFESPSGLLFSLSLRFQFIPFCRLFLSRSPCVSAGSC